MRVSLVGGSWPPLGWSGAAAKLAPEDAQINGNDTDLGYFENALLLSLLEVVTAPSLELRSGELTSCSGSALRFGAFEAEVLVVVSESPSA